MCAILNFCNWNWSEARSGAPDGKPLLQKSRHWSQLLLYPLYKKLFEGPARSESCYGAPPQQLLPPPLRDSTVLQPPGCLPRGGGHVDRLPGAAVAREDLDARCGAVGAQRATGAHGVELAPQRFGAAAADGGAAERDAGDDERALRAGAVVSGDELRRAGPIPHVQAATELLLIEGNERMPHRLVPEPRLHVPLPLLQGHERLSRGAHPPRRDPLPQSAQRDAVGERDLLPPRVHISVAQGHREAPTEHAQTPAAHRGAVFLVHLHHRHRACEVGVAARAVAAPGANLDEVAPGSEPRDKRVYRLRGPHWRPVHRRYQRRAVRQPPRLRHAAVAVARRGMRGGAPRCAAQLRRAPCADGEQQGRAGEAPAAPPRHRAERDGE
eukprot:gene218-biopygen19583